MFWTDLKIMFLETFLLLLLDDYFLLTLKERMFTNNKGMQIGYLYAKCPWALVYHSYELVQRTPI